MISSLHGTVLHIGPDSIEILVAGVGYTVAVTPDVVRSARVREPIVLFTNLIVREDALSLVGFADRPQAALFTILLGVSGVGPKSALGILAAMSVDDIARAVADDDDAPFRRVSGIGPKTAKLIVVQLAGKLAPPAPSTTRGATVDGDVSAQVIAALVGLGWSERTAADAVASVADDLTDDERATVPAFLRRTLAALGPARQEVARG
jgi:Holliday junction DNA helicase RuvA